MPYLEPNVVNLSKRSDLGAAWSFVRTMETNHINCPEVRLEEMRSYGCAHSEPPRTPFLEAAIRGVGFKHFSRKVLNEKWMPRLSSQLCHSPCFGGGFRRKEGPSSMIPFDPYGASQSRYRTDIRACKPFSKMLLNDEFIAARLQGLQVTYFECNVPP